MSTTKKIGEYSEAHLFSVSKDVVEKKTKDSVILDTKAEDRIPKFELSGKLFVSFCGCGCYYSIKVSFKIISLWIVFALAYVY
jgi:hypothetical protein